MYTTYRRIETWNDVPRAGPLDANVRESHRLDLKETVAPDKTAEHAKDMATFANTFGGVILIGAAVDKGIVTYPGVSREHATKLAEIYEQTAKDMCSPSPVVDAIMVPIPDGSDVLLAVNVDPVIDGPVGARAAKSQDAWVFPVREASHTKYLRPNELPMYMNPQLRRSILLLDQIRFGADVLLWHYPERRREDQFVGPVQLESLNSTIGEVYLNKNAVTFAVPRNGPPIRVPLTDIECVWEDSRNRWNLRLAGHVHPGGYSSIAGFSVLPHFAPVMR